MVINFPNYFVTLILPSFYKMKNLDKMKSMIHANSGILFI